MATPAAWQDEEYRARLRRYSAPRRSIDVDLLEKVLAHHADALLHGTLESPREVAEVLASEYEAVHRD